MMAIDSPSAVRLYPLDHPALVLTTRRKIEAERENQILNLGGGLASSFDDYKYRAGIIEGLRLALILTEESEKELNQRN